MFCVPLAVSLFKQLTTEIQAAGLIPVVHASGGSMMDIVTPLNESSTGACLFRSGSHRRFG